MIWMGIALRCLLLLFNFVMFRYVLSYEIREKACWPLAALTAAAAVLLPVIFPNWFSVTAAVQILSWVNLFLLFAHLKIGVVLTYDLCRASVYSFFMGILTAVLQFDRDVMIDWYRATLICNAFILLFFVLLAILLRKKREKIHAVLLNIPLWTYLIFTAILTIPTFSYYSTAEEDVLKVEGILTIVDGLTGMILTITIALGVWLYFQRKELRTQVELNERCIKEQTGQYHLLYEKQQELRRFRHDSSAHLQAIASIAKDAGDQRVFSYVSDLMGQQAEMKHLATGNLIGDAVVNAYYSKGLRDGIQVELVGQFADNFNVSETALCVIFTNVIANAYEAALKCEKNRSVRISFTNFRDHQFIRVQNPTSERPVIEDGIIQLGQTTKADKENHGLGVRNILDAVKHAGGQVQWNLDEQDGQIDVFTEIRLPIHPDTEKKLSTYNKKRALTTLHLKLW